MAVKRRKNQKKYTFASWFPKASAITFVFSLFAFLSPDISKLVDNSPLLFNFFFGVSISSVLVVAWNRNKLAGITFIFLGMIYALATWNKILAVSTISTSFWLILTGFLFLVAEEDALSEKKLAAKKIRKN
jgi:hypothetical protein